MRGPARTAGTLCALLALGAPAAWAQDSATAEALFRRGVEQIGAGEYGGACPAIAESFRLESRPGTLFTLAECEAQAGLLASAVAHYGDYLALYSRMSADQRQLQQGRDTIAQQQLERLTPSVPKLVLVLRQGAPPGTLVRRDGVPLGSPSLGVPLPVDPGEHEIVTQAPGGPLTSLRLRIAPGEVQRVVLDVAPPTPTEELRTQVKPTTAGAGGAPRATGVSGNSAARPVVGHGRRVVASIAAGVGVEGLVVGSIAGALAWDKKQIVERECEDRACTADGKRAGDAGRSLALLSTLSFGIGVAGAGAAAVLWASAPRERPAAARSMMLVVAPFGEGGYAGIRGRF